MPTTAWGVKPPIPNTLKGIKSKSLQADNPLTLGLPVASLQPRSLIVTTQPQTTDPRVSDSGDMPSIGSDAWDISTDAPGDLATGCASLLDHLVGIVSATRASLMVVNPLTGRLSIRAAIGLPPEIVGLDVRARRGSIAEWVFRQRRALLLNGEVNDQRFEGSAGKSVESAISVPLLNGDTIVGVLNLARETTAPVFNDGDLRIAQDLAPHVAMAVERMQETLLAERAWSRVRAIRTRGLKSQVPLGRSEVRGYQFGYAHLSSQQMSADLCDRASHANGEHSILFTDSAFDGPEALVASSLVQGMFVGFAVQDRSPVALVSRLNAELCGRLAGGMTVGLWSATLTPSGQMTYCNAALPPALWITGDGKIHPLQTAGIAAGGSQHARYEEESIRLMSGDVVVVATDALLQTPDSADRPFGIERLGEVLSENLRQPLDQLVDCVMGAVLEYGGRPVPPDDLSLLAIRFTRE